MLYPPLSPLPLLFFGWECFVAEVHVVWSWRHWWMLANEWNNYPSQHEDSWWVPKKVKAEEGREENNLWLYSELARRVCAYIHVCTYMGESSGYLKHASPPPSPSITFHAFPPCQPSLPTEKGKLFLAKKRLRKKERRKRKRGHG